MKRRGENGEEEEKDEGIEERRKWRRCRKKKRQGGRRRRRKILNMSEDEEKMERTEEETEQAAAAAAWLTGRHCHSGGRHTTWPGRRSLTCTGLCLWYVFRSLHLDCGCVGHSIMLRKRIIFT